MRRFALLVMLFSAGGLAGCPDDLGDGNGLTPRPAPRTFLSNPFRNTRDPNANGRTKPTHRLVVTMRVASIEVPVGTASGSEEIWSYLDEEPVRAVRSANLGRNGLRVGLGKLGTWPDLARIFKRMTGRSPEQKMVACIPGNPLPVVLKERREARTVFTFHDDRTLSGRDYPAGDYLLAVVCTLDEDNPSEILLTAMPQVRSSRRSTHYVMGDRGPRIVTRPEVFGFPQLTFQLRVPGESFLVIGPGANARNPTSVGHHFLVKKKQGMEFETLLVLIPEVLAAPVK